jgi:hypothetical protein
LVVDGGGTLNAVGVTLAENTTSGAASPVITVENGGTLALDNSLVWGSAGAQSPWLSLGASDVTTSVTSSCGPAELAAFGTSTTLTASPFVDLGAHFPFLQADSSPCIDQGSDVGEDYSALSAVVPFSADIDGVDAGYHFAASSPLSGELAVSPTEASWNIDSSATLGCWLAIPSESVFISAGTSGTYDHSFANGTEFLLICRTLQLGSAPVVLRASL